MISQIINFICGGIVIENIQGYQILQKIDETFYSQIFRAKREFNRQPVIIKLLKTQYPSPSKIARFKQEYEIIKSITDEHVIKVYDIVEVSGKFALVLEDFNGISLKEAWSTREFSLKEFLEIAITLSSTLGNLHKENILHMDIKPHNIFINMDNKKIKIADFGISTIMVQREEEICNPHIIGGTLAYMSPEQTGRMNRVVDYRSDLYSLGVTFYELLTGRVPFSSSDPMEVVHSHIAVFPVPPHEVNKEIPEVVSSIVLKLMNKTAEERYQNSFGLMADLKICLEKLIDKGDITPFPLAQNDISLRFNLPQKLYGREKEIESLISAFDRCANGNVEIMFVAGHSGIGKSALIYEVQKPIIARRGFFAFGKYEQFRRDIPYNSIIQAFQGLLKQLLSEKKEKIIQWEKEILKAVGSNGKLIIQIIPDVALIIGPQPDVPEIGPVESQNRFDYVFTNFVKVFANNDHPLTLFLDDLQWADTASLQLLQKLMIDQELKYFFFIGSYRDNEADDAHPTMIMIREIMKSGMPCTEIILEPLTQGNVSVLIRTFLKCNEEKAGELAELVHGKTGGCPFFISQFLKILYDDKIIEPAPSGWKWDTKKIQAMQLTDNVVELLAEKITKLRDKASDILKICACVGNWFDLETLSLILSRPIDDIFPDINEVIREGFIGIVGDIYMFQHDRIREAAYGLIPQEERIRLHYKIGRLTIEGCDETGLDKKVFYILSHLNQCLNLLSDDEERRELISLNMRAGIKAKASSAYAPAFAYLKIGLSLLPRDSWKSEYRQVFNFHLNAAEAACLIGDFNEVNRLCSIVKKETKHVLDLAKLGEIEILSSMSHDKPDEAVNRGIKILKQLGINIPSNPNVLHVFIYLIKVQSAMRGRKVEDLLNIPVMSDPGMLQAMRILSRLGTSAYKYSFNTFLILAFKAILLTLKYGITASTATTFAAYAVVLCGLLYKFDLGNRWEHTAFKILEKFKDREFLPPLYLTSGFIWPWKRHIRDVIRSHIEGYKLGMEMGDHEYAANNCCAYVGSSYAANKNLNELESETRKYIKILRQMKHKHAINYTSIDMQSFQNLMGKSEDPCTLTGEFYNIAEGLPVHQDENDALAIGYVYNNTQVLAYLFGNYRKSFEYAKLQKKYLAFMAASNAIPKYYLYYSLAMLALYGNEKKAERKKIFRTVKANQKFLRMFSKACPANFLTMYLLVEAERYRVLGDFIRAAKTYDEAIEQARDNEFILLEALGNELAAKFYLAHDRKKIARMYMNESHYCYNKFGAAGKVSSLVAGYPDLLQSSHTASAIPDYDKGNMSGSTGSGENGTLDFSTIIKASQTISGEIHLGKLLERMLWITIENAGAQKGIIILENERGLFVEAEGATEKKGIDVLQSIPVDDFHGASLSIISYVARSKETLILNNASMDVNFINDVYIKENKIKSVLCAPILNQGKLLGVVYLENNLIADAFTPERLEVLQILSSQVAVSIENARLYDNLEEKVRERTVELQRTRDALWGEMELAKRIQTALLPKAPVIEGYEISVHMDPANEVGGDYYDIINVQGKNWIMIGDVCGHGVTAGLIMMMAQTSISMALQDNPDSDPSKLLEAVNIVISANIKKLGEEKYMTLTAFACGEGGTFHFSGLHQDILVYRAEKDDVEIIASNGMWLGLVEDIKEMVIDGSFTLQPGDMMLLFTDGITEAMKKESARNTNNDFQEVIFGNDRLVDVFRKYGKDSTEDVKNAVLYALEDYICEDDVTMVILKRLQE